MKKDEFLYGALLHLGMNMWSDRPYPRPAEGGYTYEIPKTLPPETYRLKRLSRQRGGLKNFLDFEEAAFHTACDYMAAKGMNFVMIDVGEGYVYPSHPELAVKGSWTPEKMRAELKRIRGLGLEPIPKLNFSTTHCAWLGEYRHAISTPEYYRVVADVIRDVYEVFDRPRLFHLGYDEEDAGHMKGFDYMVIRQGELWWHDFLYTVGLVEKLGARPWIWSDKIWHHRDEFVKRCPKSILQSNWYYLADFAPSEKSALYPMVHAYDWLEKAGFDQVPCCSNCGDWNMLKTNTRKTVEYVKPIIAPERFKGMMTAPWARSAEPFLGWIKEAIDMLAEVKPMI